MKLKYWFWLLAFLLLLLVGSLLGSLAAAESNINETLATQNAAYPTRTVFEIDSYPVSEADCSATYWTVYTSPLDLYGYVTARLNEGEIKIDQLFGLALGNTEKVDLTFSDQTTLSIANCNGQINVSN